MSIWSIEDVKIPQPLRRLPSRFEAVLLITLLSLMSSLALVIPIRRWWHQLAGTTLAHPWIDSIAQTLAPYSVLWVAFVGAWIATAQSKHIKMDALNRLLPHKWVPFLDGLSWTLCSIVCAMLCQASCRLVFPEGFAQDRIAAGLIPRWSVELILPLGFGVLALHFLWILLKLICQGFRVVAGVATAVLTSVLLWKTLSVALASGHLTPYVLLCFLVLFLLLLFGAPIFVILSAAGILSFKGIEGDASWFLIPIMEKMGRNPYLIAIPLFTFAGYLLAESKAPARLVALSQAALGWMPGGLSIVTLVSCTFATAFIGANGATIVALGGLLFPALLKEGYKDRFSLGLITTCGCMGVLLPPSLPLLLYGFVTETSIDSLFKAGLLPSLLMVVLLSVYCILKGRGLQRNAGPRPPIGRSLRECAWEIPIPILVLGGIYSGLTTVTESAALSVVYVLFVECVIKRDISFTRKLPEIMVSSMVLVGAILLVLSCAVGFTEFLTDQSVADQLLQGMKEHLHNKVLFLLGLNVLLLVVGCLMDELSAIVVVAPLIKPVSVQLGIDEIHLGIIFLTNLQIGYIHPPLGMTLFVSSSRFNRPILQVFVATLPFLGLLLLSLILITYIPGLSLAFVK